MATRQQVVPIRLDDSTTINAAVTFLGGEEDVKSSLFKLDDVTDQIRAISRHFATVLDDAKPDKAGLEFGIQLSVKEGRLTALLVSGEATATLKVSLEWGGTKRHA